MNQMTVRRLVNKPVVPDPLDPAVVLTHADLQAIGKQLHRNISDREGLLTAVANAATVNVNGAKVTLEPRLLQRLKSRCLDKGNFQQWLADSIVRQLHDLVGW